MAGSNPAAAPIPAAEGDAVSDCKIIALPFRWSAIRLKIEMLENKPT